VKDDLRGHGAFFLCEHHFGSTDSRIVAEEPLYLLFSPFEHIFGNIAVSSSDLNPQGNLPVK
jgi:hypothetical protein